MGSYRHDGCRQATVYDSVCGSVCLDFSPYIAHFVVYSATPIPAEVINIGSLLFFSHGTEATALFNLINHILLALINQYAAMCLGSSTKIANTCFSSKENNVPYRITFHHFSFLSVQSFDGCKSSSSSSSIKPEMQHKKHKLFYDFSVMRILFMYCCKHVRLTCVQ